MILHMRRLPCNLTPVRLALLLVPLAIALLLVLLLLPAHRLTPQRLGQLRPGLTDQQVHTLLGPPGQRTAYGGAIDGTPVSTETWVYQSGRTRWTLHFADHRLTRIESAAP